MLEKEMLTSEGPLSIHVVDYISELSEEDLQSKITESQRKPKTILVIGGGSQVQDRLSQPSVYIGGEFLVGGQYAMMHPVETLKYLDHVFSEVLNSGRGGGVVDDRSDCSVLEGFFE